MIKRDFWLKNVKHTHFYCIIKIRVLYLHQFFMVLDLR